MLKTDASTFHTCALEYQYSAMRFTIGKKTFIFEISKTEIAAIFAASSFVITIVATLIFANYFMQNRSDLVYKNYQPLELSTQTVPGDVVSALKTGNYPFLHDATKSADTASPSPVTYHIPFLMYHYVEYVRDRNDKTRIMLNTPPHTLEEQITTLKNDGYTFLVAREVGDILDGKRQMPDKPIVLTFDDGYGDFYTDVFPILKRQGVRATIYVISGFLGKPNYMTREQVKEMLVSGYIELGDHTVHHWALRGRKLEEVTHEIADSKITLEKEFGVPIVSFCYPYGSFDVQAISVAASVGYKTAVTTVPGTTESGKERLLIPRLRSGGKTGKALLDWLAYETKR